MSLAQWGRPTPTARRKALPEGRARKPVKGATRKTPAVKPKRKPSAWLNRLIILTGAGVVMVAALQAYITLQSIPVQHITVTGELEHTRTSLIQDMIQPALVGGFLQQRFEVFQVNAALLVQSHRDDGCKVLSP